MLVILESPPNGSISNWLGRFLYLQWSSRVHLMYIGAMLISIFEASIYLCSKGRDAQKLIACKLLLILTISMLTVNYGVSTQAVQYSDV